MIAALAKPAPIYPTLHTLSGYRPAYQSGCRCPGCGRSHWWVRTMTAQCAFCETALPLGRCD